MYLSCTSNVSVPACTQAAKLAAQTQSPEVSTVLAIKALCKVEFSISKSPLSSVTMYVECIADVANVTQR
jgi:hypothetical protein